MDDRDSRFVTGDVPSTVVAMAAENPTVFVRAHLYPMSGLTFLCGRPHNGLLLPVPTDLHDVIVCPYCRAALRKREEAQEVSGEG